MRPRRARAGVTDEALASLGPDWAAKADYNLDRMLVHGARRADELDEVATTLAALGIDPTMSRAAAGWQRRLARGGAPAGLAAKLRRSTPPRRSAPHDARHRLHGHFTTAPPAHDTWRQRQVAAFDAGVAAPPYPAISDDDLRAAVEANQLRLLRERGADMTIFSPRASAMGPHVGDATVSLAWGRACNDLIARVVGLYPETFIGVCQLPQSPHADLAASIAELVRCVAMGFVGCNLNPDPGGGYFASPPLTDRSWYPFYEKMVELDVPAMVHVSGSCNPGLHATGAYYLAADTIAFMQFLEGDLFADFPTLRFIIPHGGGAVPYHWGRYRGLADMLRKPRPRRPSDEERVLRHLRLSPARHRPDVPRHRPG